MNRILFIASLHHPQTLLAEQALAHQDQQIVPLFPSSYAFYFWEKALLKHGYTVDVFWRNVSGFRGQNISQLHAQKYTEQLSLQRIGQAAVNRLPYVLNPDLRRRNANLIAHARQYQPTHLWLIGDNRVIHTDTLAQLKAEHHCKLIYSTGTSPIVFSHAIERQAAPLMDLVLVNDYYHGIQWRELGAQAMLCLPVVAIDPDFHYPRPYDPEFACDIGFVGTLLPPNLYSERVSALEHLRDFDLGIWSVHDVPASLKAHQRGSALGEQMLRVLSSSRISLNVHGNFMRYGGNMRLFETASVGVLQLVDQRDGLAEWFTADEHLVVFDDYDDLRDKARYYLDHEAEREAIASAARKHVLAHHTYDHRLATLIELGIL